MINFEFGQVKKSTGKKDLGLSCKSRVSTDSMYSLQNTAPKDFSTEKTFIVNKVNWSKELFDRVDDAFTSPDQYLKESNEMFFSKFSRGPKFGDKLGKEVVPYSIVGCSEKFLAMLNAKNRQNDKNVGSKKKSNNTMMSLNNRIGTIQELKSIRSSTNIKSSALMNSPCSIVDEDAILKVFRKINERIEENVKEEQTQALTFSNNILNRSFSSNEEDYEEYKLTSMSPFNYPHLMTSSSQTASKVKGTNSQFGKSINQQAQLGILTKQNDNSEDKSTEAVYDSELMKTLRKKLKKKYYNFADKIYKNRVNINYKSSIPFEIQSEINHQSQFFSKQKENEIRLREVAASLKKLTNKNEKELLFNRLEDTNLKSAFKRVYESSKPLCDKLGSYQWMASLRKPAKLIGERRTFYNTGDDHWYQITEKEPNGFEISVPLTTEQSEILKSTKLNSNEGNKHLHEGSQSHNSRIKINKLDLKDITKSNTEMTSRSTLKSPSATKTMIGSIENREDKSEMTSLAKKVMPIINLQMTGTSLLDFELAHSKLLKGKKILYNQNINPESQKEFLEAEKCEEVYLLDYPNTLKHLKLGEASKTIKYNLAQSQSARSFVSNPAKTPKKVIWN